MVLFLIVGCTLSSANEIKDIELKQSDILIKKLSLEKKISIKLFDQDYFFLAVSKSSIGNIYALDKYSSQILMFNEDGRLIKRVGGSGRGPGELLIEHNANLIACRGSIIVYDWSLPRLQIYDENLDLKDILNLEGIPYEVGCIEDEQIIILFSNRNLVQKMELNGNIEKSFSFDDSQPFDLDIFKRIISYEETLFVSYLFRPVLFRWENNAMVERVTLPIGERDSIITATKNLSLVDSSLHVFFYNLGSTKTKDKRKIGHVFSAISTKYKYSYYVPIYINDFKILTNSQLIALEDTLSRISIYDYKIQ